MAPLKTKNAPARPDILRGDCFKNRKVVYFPHLVVHGVMLSRKASEAKPQPTTWYARCRAFSGDRKTEWPLWHWLECADLLDPKMFRRTGSVVLP